MNPGPNKSANEYLRTKIFTASPEELRMMLYEGAIKYCRQAKQAISVEEIERSYDCLMRVQKIVMELSTSLKHEVAPELCEKLSALYTYMYRRLIDANLEKQVQPIDEVLKLLEYQKETWHMLMEKTAAESMDDAKQVDQLNISTAQQTAINSLSVDG